MAKAQDWLLSERAREQARQSEAGEGKVVQPGANVKEAEQWIQRAREQVHVRVASCLEVLMCMCVCVCVCVCVPACVLLSVHFFSNGAYWC